jgi:hypothetical protein
MLNSTQKEKLSNQYKWDNARQRANFYHGMSRTLKRRLDEFRDLIYLIEKLPPQTLENIKLVDNLPQSIALLESILSYFKPWPVAEYKDRGPASIITIGKRKKDQPGKCWPASTAWAATTKEIAINKMLKDHDSNIQRYIDPYLIYGCHDLEDVFEADLDRVRSLGIERRYLDNINYYSKKRGDWITIDEEEIKKGKRWNPIGLPPKYDVPEQKEEA